MPLSYTEYYNANTGLTIGLKKLLFSEQSPYQLVEVYETDTWGNLMTIDGMVMLSEKDEFVYHEMLTHVGLFAHPDPRRVLIVGGGDGGSAREVLRHSGVEKVDMVEIDETVVRASQQCMPGVGNFEDPRLHVIYENGLSFIKRVEQSYDVIIVDGSDPVGPALDLFQQDFYSYCYRALSDSGIMTAQTESPWVTSYQDRIRSLFTVLQQTFDVSRMYLAFIPLYPTGMWSLAFASKGQDPLAPEVMERVKHGVKQMNGALRYYNQEIHSGSFALPNFVHDIIR